MDGEVVTATKLNLAAAPTIADGGSYAFADGTVGAPSISFNSDKTTGFFYGSSGVFKAAFGGALGATLSATSWTLLNSGANMQWSVGQDATHSLVLQWTYNATPGSALATITTFGQNNPIKMQFSTFSADSTSQANFMQVFASGRTLFSAAGSDDGVNFLQAQGGLGYDRLRCPLTTITYASTTNLDFDSGNDLKTESLTGNVTFTTSNLGVGRVVVLRIICDGSNRTFTFPSGWTFVGGAAPTSITASKTAILSLTSFSTTDASVVAAYAVQP